MSPSLSPPATLPSLSASPHMQSLWNRSNFPALHVCKFYAPHSPFLTLASSPRVSVWGALRLIGSSCSHTLPHLPPGLYSAHFSLCTKCLVCWLAWCFSCSSSEATELVVEYWTGKKEKEKVCCCVCLTE